MTQQCYLLNYTVNYEFQSLILTHRLVGLNFLDQDQVLPGCKDVVKAILCAYIYPDCNPSTRLPVGICSDECYEYVYDGICRESFAHVPRKSEDSQKIDTFLDSPLDCNDSLSYIVLHDQSFVNQSVDLTCINPSCKLLSHCIHVLYCFNRYNNLLHA